MRLKLPFGLTKNSQSSNLTLVGGPAGAFVCWANPQRQTPLQNQCIGTDQATTKEIFQLFWQATVWQLV